MPGDGCSSTCKTENPGSRTELAVVVCIVTTFIAVSLIAIQSVSKNKAQKSSKSEKELQRINKVQIQCETKIKMTNYSQSHSHCKMLGWKYNCALNSKNQIYSFMADYNRDINYR